MVIQGQDITRRITALNSYVVPRWMLGKSRQCKCHCEEDCQHEFLNMVRAAKHVAVFAVIRWLRNGSYRITKMMVGIVLGMIVTRPTMAVPHKSGAVPSRESDQ